MARPRALGACLDEPVARRLGDGGRQALRVDPRPRDADGDDLIVADGLPVGRVLGHGSVALYRPDPAAPLRHRLLEVDPRGRVTVALNRGARGELHEAWVSLADGSAVGVLPGGAHHPLWGPSDRLVHATAGGAPTTLTLAAAVSWNAVDLIPPVAEPGPASLRRRRRAAERPRGARVGPGPARAALSRPVSDGAALLEPHRVLSLAPGPGADPLARFLADAEGTFARGAPEEAPVDWMPAPHERRVHSDGLVVQLRDGVERITWQGRSYHRTECQGLRRREHRVVRRVEAEGRRAALRRVPRGARNVAGGSPHARRAGRAARAPRARLPTRPVETPLAAPWREALGALLPLEATPLLAGAIEAVWPGIQLAWGPVPGDLVETRAGRRSGSRRSSRASTGPRGRTPRPDARRALAQQLVREVLGLIGPAVREAAAAWLEALPAARQEAELARPPATGSSGAAALAPLGRLLDALLGRSPGRPVEQAARPARARPD